MLTWPLALWSGSQALADTRRRDEYVAFVKELLAGLARAGVPEQGLRDWGLLKAEVGV